MTALFKILALFALLLASPAAAHYTTITNTCSRLKLSGSISDARWRGRSKPIAIGRTTTEGDTTVQLSTGFGTITVKLFDSRLSLTTNLNFKSAPAGFSLTGFLAFDVPKEDAKQIVTCSSTDKSGCSSVQGLVNDKHWPGYVQLEFSC